jgi:hypothetical protein
MTTGTSSRSTQRGDHKTCSNCELEKAERNCRSCPGWLSSVGARTSRGAQQPTQGEHRCCSRLKGKPLEEYRRGGQYRRRRCRTPRQSFTPKQKTDSVYGSFLTATMSESSTEARPARCRPLRRRRGGSRTQAYTDQESPPHVQCAAGT